MGLAVGFPWRLVAEKVTSTVCLEKICLTCPLISWAAPISTERIHFSVKLGCFAGSLIYPPVGTWNACCRPQGALAACLHTGGWPGSVTPTAFCSQEMESFVRIFVLHLQRPGSCRHIKSAWALPVCFSCMSFSYPCPLVRDRNNTETLCWGTGRCEDPASNTQPLHAANCWDPGKHVA